MGPDGEVGETDVDPGDGDDSDKYPTRQPKRTSRKMTISRYNTRKPWDLKEWAEVDGRRRNPETILELLFGLSLALCKEKPLDDNPGSVTIVFFSGILGFSDALQSFLLAWSYTPCLCHDL